jgi:hypothetical protein
MHVGSAFKRNSFKLILDIVDAPTEDEMDVDIPNDPSDGQLFLLV